MKFLKWTCTILLAVCLLYALDAAETSGAIESPASYCSLSIFHDFKTVLMFFSEAFLKGAKFGTKSLEGEVPLIMPRQLIRTIELIGNDWSYDGKISTLKAFKDRLKVGLRISSKIIGLAGLFDSQEDSQDMVHEVQRLQEFTLEMIGQGSVIIPAGWIGHATVLIVEFAGIDTESNPLFNIIVVNSGDGLQYHYFREDPESISPHLTRLWIEFKNIPKEKIFASDSPWFIYGLVAINQNQFVTNIRNIRSSIADYFYGSFLANFQDYLAQPEINGIDDKLVREQRSGSCAMSSLMAALLYYADSLETFYWYRLKIGHVLLGNFQMRLESAGVDAGVFKNVLKNGFYSGGFKLYKGLIRALAYHQLQYLEYKFPNEFKHAGLIGSGGSDWITNKKFEAIRILSSDETAIKELETTIQLAKSIQKFTNNLEYLHETTHLKDMRKITSLIDLEKEKIFLSPLWTTRKQIDEAEELKMEMAKDAVNIYEIILSGKPERLEMSKEPFESFQEFCQVFSNHFQMKDDLNEVYFMRFLDIFKRLHSGASWYLIANHDHEEELLQLQEQCKLLALKFAQLSNQYSDEKPRQASLDEITLLGHLQLLSWNIFRALHMLRFPNSTTNWNDLVPPQSVQSILLAYVDRKAIISGDMSRFPIKGFNDMENYKLYKLFVEDGRSSLVNPESNLDGVVAFPGPEFYTELFDKLTYESVSYDVIEKAPNLGDGVFKDLTDLPQVDALLAKLRKNFCIGYVWESLPDFRAKFYIVLGTGQKDIFQPLAHFYNLMHTLQSLRLGAMSLGAKFYINGPNSENRWLVWTDNLRSYVFSYRPHFRHTKTGKLALKSCTVDVLMEARSPSELFYFIQHSKTLPSEIGMTDVDNWLNYIKSARSSKIFDNPKFQYVTDHLLNIPKYKRNSHEITLIFDADKAKTIIFHLIRLVRGGLSELSNVFSCSRREIIVKRAVNISVILTRFISRADYEFNDSPINWGKLLAKLYNTVEPYSYLNSETFKLRNAEVSMLNFALSHMCFAHLSKPETFTKSIRLRLNYSYKRHRGTLAKFHWFVAKMEYTISADPAIADDQFRYGFVGSPISAKEVRFLEALLKEKFLLHYLKQGIDIDYDFRYNPEGYVVEITIKKGSSRILINLATGEIIENCFMLTDKSKFINSTEFQSFFDSADHDHLSNSGKAFVYAGIPVFAIPNFNGSEYFMINYSCQFWLLRKWKDNWYIWRPETYERQYFEALNHAWNMESIKIFKKYNNNEGEVEMIIYGDESNDPILQITKFEQVLELEDGKFQYRSHFQLSIPGLTDGNSFAIIKRDESGKYNEKHIEMHLLEFSKDVTLARSNSTADFILVYNGLRLPEAPSKPLVIASCHDKVLILNIRNMEICTDQRIGLDGLSLPGSLVATVDGRKVLLLPLAENLESSLTRNYSRPYIQIQSIPLDNSNVPTPQSRMHKMLLAYFMILAQNYDSARKLLHPSTSLHQNEIFSRIELEIILWIITIQMDAPEYYALKLVVFSHLLLNEAKFAFEYTSELSEIVDEIKKSDSRALFKNYMMIIRELPEKYYIFKMFPDVLVDNSVLSKAFFRADGTKLSFIKASENFRFPVKFNGFVEKFKPGYRVNFAQFCNSLKFGPESMTTNLLIRNSSSLRFDSGLEMAIYCHAKRPDVWAKFKLMLNRIKYKFEDKHALEAEFKDVLSTCRIWYRNEFEGISLAKLSRSSDSEKIKETMRKHLRFRPDNNNNFNVDADEIIPDETKNHILEFMDESINFIKSLNSNSVKLTDEIGMKLSELNTTILSKVDELSLSQKYFSEALIEEAYPEIWPGPLSHTIENLFSMMHQRKQKTFSDLYACFLRDSLSCIQRKFPQLNEEQCRKIHLITSKFYRQQILLDYLKQLQQSADSFLNAQYISIDELLIFCDELEKISKFNERLQNPVIMNFELRSQKYRLKSEQVEDIELLTSEESDNFKSVVIQRMMAAGKTLVLGTISVVMKALKQNDTLSILVPPSSLYQSNTSDMQTRTYKYFKKKGETFSFPRLPLSNNEENKQRISYFLDNVINTINNTIANRNYLILSPDHLQSFLNSYIEAIEDASATSTSDNIVILKKFATIYKIFKEKSSIILDEIDMTMDPKKELNFPTIEVETYNMIAVAMLADIIEFMLFDERIREAGLNVHSNNQAALTAENYIKCKEIVLEYIEAQLLIEGSLWRSFVPENIAAKAIEFMKMENIMYGKDWILEVSKTSGIDLANALIIVRTQLDLHMEEFLAATVNQNYGPAGPSRSDIQFAVPYVAANTPSHGSIFADRWETLIKTLLMVSASPCSMQTAKAVIKYIRKASISESVGKEDKSFENFPSYMNMKMILPDNIDPLILDEKSSFHVEIVYKSLTFRSPAAIRILFGYFINEILVKMEFPVEQITSNALHMTSMFASVQGYSGTIDNVNVLPQRVIKEAYEDHERNEKNNVDISFKLVQDFNDAILSELRDESFSKSSIEMMSDFLRLFEAEHPGIDQLSAIIDAGAFFKNFKNKTVAEAILHLFKGSKEVVLFYDEISNQLEFVRGVFDSEALVSITTGRPETTDSADIYKATGTAIEKRFTFYDQRHITGSDILQPKAAHAILTAGPRVLLRDILQGTLRMRQFMTSQRVRLVVTESVRKFYCNRINTNKEHMWVSDLLALGQLNEEEKQEFENERLAFVKIDSEIRAFILNEISELLMNPTVDTTRIAALFKQNLELFIRPIKENPIAWLHERKPRNTAELLAEHVALRLNRLRPFYANAEERIRFDNLSNKLALMYRIDNKHQQDSLLYYMKEEIFERFEQQTIGTEVLMQTQSRTQTLTLAELDRNQLDQQFNGKILLNRYYEYDLVSDIDSNYNHDIVEYASAVNLKQIYQAQSDNWKELTRSLLISSGEQIGVTSDLVQLYENQNRTLPQFPIFSALTLEGSHLLIYTAELLIFEYKVILISSQHAAAAYEDIRKKRSCANNSIQYWLCDLSGDLVISTDQSRESESPVDVFSIPYLTESIFDIFIFNGSLLQILAYPKLKVIYENVWLKGDDAKERAKFLLLRMKALAEKNSVMFEDGDEEFEKLKQFASGNYSQEEKVKIGSYVYGKGAINPEVQAKFDDKKDVIEMDSNNRMAELLDYAKAFFQSDKYDIMSTIIELQEINLESEVEDIATGDVSGSEYDSYLDENCHELADI